MASQCSEAKEVERLPLHQRRLVKFYTVGYNLCALGAWTYVGYLVASECPLISKSNTWDAFISKTSKVTLAVQCAQGLEVVHALLGIVKTPPVAAISQVLGRLLALNLTVIYAMKDSAFGGEYWPQRSHYFCGFYTAMLASWSVAEMIRYPLYIAKTAGFGVPSLLSWLRYNAFIVLYPLGYAAETALYYELYQLLYGLHSRKAVAHSWTEIHMPNSHNFIFTWRGFLMSYVPLTAVGFLSLYKYMFAQRKKQQAVEHHKDKEL